MGIVSILDPPSWLLHANYQAIHISISHSSVFQPDFHHGQDLRGFRDVKHSSDIRHSYGYIHWLHVIIICGVRSYPRQ